MSFISTTGLSAVKKNPRGIFCCIHWLQKFTWILIKLIKIYGGWLGMIYLGFRMYSSKLFVSHFPVKVKIESGDVIFYSAHKCMLMTTVVFTPPLSWLFWFSDSFRILLRIKTMLMNIVIMRTMNEENQENVICNWLTWNFFPLTMNEVWYLHNQCLSSLI